MSKTPYEVRLDILHMAQKLLSEETFAERLKHELALQNEDIAVDKTARTMHLDGVAKATYTANDVISQASTLYAFVNNNKD